MDPDLQQQGPDQVVGIGDYLSVFSRRAWLIVIPFLLVLGVSAALAFLLPAQFKADTVVIVEDTSVLDTVYSNVDVLLPVKPLLTTIKQVILRRSFLEKIVDDNDIREGFDVNNPREKTRLFAHILTRLKVRLVQQDEGPDVINIEYQGREARKVTNFLNDIRERYVNSVLDRRRVEVRKRLDDLESRLKASQRSVESVSKNYERFQRENDYQVFDGKALSGKHLRLASVRDQLASEQVKERQSQKELDEVGSLLNAEPKIVEQSTTQVKSLAWINQRVLIRTLDARLKDARDKFTTRYPLIAQLEKHLVIQRDKLNQIPEFDASQKVTNINPIWQGLKSRQDELKTQLQGLGASIEALGRQRILLEEHVDLMPTLQRQEAELSRRRTSVVEQAAVLTRRAGALRSTWNKLNSPEGNIFRVLQAPLLEEADSWDPVFPSVPLFVGIGSFIGLLIGAGLAFLVEFSSSSFVTVNQLRRTLPVAVLGQMGVLRTPEEVKKRRSRSIVAWVVVLTIVAVLVYGHVCYFSPELRTNLPTWLFKIMKGFYGSQ